MARLKKNRYGSIITEQGNITPKMQREFQQMVKKANNQRDRMLTKIYNTVKNMPTMNNIDKKAYAEVLQEKGFLPHRTSGSLGQFDSVKAFKEELKDIRTLTSTKYHDNKLGKARNKMLETVEKNYNSDGDKIINVINNLTDEEFIQLYTAGPDDLIKALYDSPTRGKSRLDDIEDRVTETLSKMEITIRNMTPKKKRKQRMEELGFTYLM